MSGENLSFIRAAIMQLLLEQPTYGAVLRDQYGELFGSDLGSGHGTIFVTLKRLEKLGYLVSEKRKPPEGEQGPPRVYYTVTKTGREALKLFKKRYHKLLEKLNG